MPTMRERIADLLLGDQKRQLQNMTRTLLEAYQAGPFEPAWTPERLKGVLSEFDSALVQDLVMQLQWERLGTFGYDASARESERLRAVRENQRLWEYDVITEWIIALWTNFGFGETVTVTPNDEAARKAWTEFWQAPRNEVLLGSDNLQSLSDNTLVEGESFLAFYVSKQDGLATVRRIGTAEITDIVTDPADTGTPLGYKRVFTNQVGGQSQTIYYPDWMAVSKAWTAGPAAEDVFAPANLPGDAKRADTMNAQTDVLMLHVAHKRKGGNRGWPLMTAGAPWIREHKRFRENRASVAEAMAMYIQKVKAKGGSRAVDSIRARLQSSLAIPGSTDAFDTNPPAAPGSTWVENEAATLERLPMGTAAGDARIDGEALLMMAGLAGGVYPHWLGAGESFRLATATAMEMPTLRNFKRYQNFWAAQFRKMVTIVLEAQEQYAGKAFEDKGASVSTDRLLEVDLKMMSEAVDGLFTNTIQPYWEAGLVPVDTVRKLAALVWREVVQALGSDDADALASDEAFGVVPAAEGEDGSTGKVLPFGRSRQRSRRRQREDDEMRESGLTIYGGGIRANFRALWSGEVSASDFITMMMLTVEAGLRAAWIEGMESAGVDRSEISTEEWTRLQARIDQENDQLPGLAADISGNNRSAGGKLGDLMPRAELWVNRYNDIVNLARTTASTDPKLKWNYGGTVDHCSDCEKYEGKIHRASIWNRVEARPQSEALACGGWRCLCSLDPTDERATPGLPPRPSGGG